MFTTIFFSLGELDFPTDRSKPRAGHTATVRRGRDMAVVPPLRVPSLTASNRSWTFNAGAMVPPGLDAVVADWLVADWLVVDHLSRKDA